MKNKNKRSLSPESITIFSFDKSNTSKKDISFLHTCLLKLGLTVSPEEIKNAEFGTTTTEAIKEYQKKAALPIDGIISEDTIKKLKVDLIHRFYVNNKTRTKKIHTTLEFLDIKIADEDKKKRVYGKSTANAIKKIQDKLALPQTGLISEELLDKLNESEVKKRFNTKTQRGKLHRLLLKVGKIAKLDPKIDSTELTQKSIGPSTQSLILAIQKKYNLSPTGKIDNKTYKKILSISSSLPKHSKKVLKVKRPDSLSPMTRTLRLNATNNQVGKLQKTLAFLGYEIDEKEYNTKKFGKTTRQAVLQYQQSNLLPTTGHIEGITLKNLNQYIKTVNPRSNTNNIFRLKGSVKDHLWNGRPKVKVEVWQKLLRGQGNLMATRFTLPNGFFDIPYSPPKNVNDKRIKKSYNLQIKVIDPKTKKELASKILSNPKKIDWINFVDGNLPYRGISEYELKMKKISEFLNNISIDEIEETEQRQDITQLAVNSGLSQEDIMKLVLSHRISKKIDDLVEPKIKIHPEICYAFLAQNLPPNLSTDLLANSWDWQEIENLVESISNGLVFMDKNLQTKAFDNAVKENLIPVSIILQKEKILDDFSKLKQLFTLEKPILIGNGNLKSVLETSDLAKEHYNEIADAAIKYGFSSSEFWKNISSHSAEFGGEKVVADLKTCIILGHITKNHTPTILFLKTMIKDHQDSKINSVKDLAKLTEEQISAFIRNNQGKVPDWIVGDTDKEKINNYARVLKNQTELLYPSIAFVSAVSKSDLHSLSKIQDIVDLLDTNEDLDIKNHNLDKYIKEKSIKVSNETLSELKVIQRVMKIIPDPSIGKILLDDKIHDSAAIVSMGKEKFVKLLQNQKIDEKIALTVYSNAEFQYASVLSKIGEYRSELHRSNPKAIVDHTYTGKEQEEFLKIVPDLQTLFGSLDFCECSHCQSVFSPSAYVSDILNFLYKQDSEQPEKTVMDILFERRPDIGNIKLNCDNANTPLPYIDLICEILENAIPNTTSGPNYNLQTTKSSQELFALPENIRPEAYDVLMHANFPMNISFNLWLEESRMFLQHLGIVYQQLMSTFQSRPDKDNKKFPSDIHIAGEFWNMSPHQTNIVETKESKDKEKQKEFWGFNITSNYNPDTDTYTVPVSEFIRHAKIEYSDLLDLINIKCIQSKNDNNKIAIQYISELCNIDKQNLINLTVENFDKIHRFLRLWRHTKDWDMWELDLLVRCPKIGTKENDIDGNTIINLRQFKDIQDKLGLAFETALSFYQDINTEIRINPQEPNKEILPLYWQLFLNQTITNPVNEKFVLPLSSDEQLSNHKTTIMAAIGIKEDELDLLTRKTLKDNKLNLSNLTTIYNYTTLARKTKLSINYLLVLEELTQIDIFKSTQDTINFIDTYEWIKNSGFSVQELDYLLNVNKDSPLHLRQEVVTQFINNLRESITDQKTETRNGNIISHIAGSFSITDEQANLLLNNLTLIDKEDEQLKKKKLLEYFIDDRLTKKNSDNKYEDIKPETKEFKGIYNSYYLLYKVAILLKRYRLERYRNLDWLLQKFSISNSLDFSSIPVDDNPTISLFPSWLVLTKWLYFKKQFPEPENSSLEHIFDTVATDGSTDQILKSISDLTQWNFDDLKTLHNGLALKHVDKNESDYNQIETYLKLLEAFRLIKLIGVGASTLLRWSRFSDNVDKQSIIAQEIKHTAKSKYDNKIWLSKIVPLQDELRENKRTALVNYLIEHSIRNQEREITFKEKKYANPKYWKSTSDLLGYFLIDVEMNACQPTSRIKQAMSSIQLFVQRCLLNLEQPYVQVSREEMEDTISLNSWKQWKWMKNYRIWEANRKVFLYPENWIEPELRDDKSPFFIELENEILQKEITTQNVEKSFFNYLNKVLEVSRLEVIGTHHEFEIDDPYNNIPANKNILHVIGRTKSQPSVYYYRQFDLNYNIWTAWEKIELDITSDHVIPVVYNRKLYLFWLVITEETQDVKVQPAIEPSKPSSRSPESPKMLEIKLAWSFKNDKGWTPKKVSPHKIIHPWQRPYSSYNLKPRYKAEENMLWLDIYISTSIDFNETEFYDPNFGKTRRFTRWRYDENARPWHSSSFVFDGNIVDIKLKSIPGQYLLKYISGHPDELNPHNSYLYVNKGFGEEGRKINLLSKSEIAPKLLLPDEMHYHNTHLRNNKSYLSDNKTFNVLEFGATKILLYKTIPPFELILSQDKLYTDTSPLDLSPFFYQDQMRTFFVIQKWNISNFMSKKEFKKEHNLFQGFKKYMFYTFYHPYADLFIRELNRSGLDGLLNRKIQISPDSFYPYNKFNFTATYRPSRNTIPDRMSQGDFMDFSQYGAFSIYNWETFFHIPFLIACKLSHNQQFEEAMHWFHFIFDPTNTESLATPQKYWITKPFFEQNSSDYRKQRIEMLLENIDKNENQIRAWKNNPFKPHLIARHRPIAYQKAIVMKYIDNLIAWGDQLFRRDTMESINEATLLYVLAYELLGPRPTKIPNTHRKIFSYNELINESNTDLFGNNKVEVLVENLIPAPETNSQYEEGNEPLPKMDILYFCIPNNDILFGYWEKVEDRLFKIRNCMNIEGIKRILPLFEPPIDPMLLVKATAAGVDLTSVLDDLGVAQGQFRYRVLVQKALEFCNDIKNLGDKILSVLERKDSEELSLLRSVHEIELLTEIEKIRKDQVLETKTLLESNELGLDVLQKKLDYYNSVPRMNVWEKGGSALHVAGIDLEILGTLLRQSAGMSYLAPQYLKGGAGSFGSPLFALFGYGENKGNSESSFSSKFQVLAAILHQTGNLLDTQGSYQRRFDEIKFLRESTTKEIKQTQKQIEAANIRLAIAEKELENTVLQIEHSKTVDEYMRNKYTNKQLYDWMLRQLTTVYFQSYQLAYDMAKRAEKSLRFELGKTETGNSFIQFGYWDSLKKGLMAGERLMKDIHRMETFYLEENRREFEIVKHISLAKLNPLSLIMLKETGKCTIELPEWLFDMDYPGHYRRRIKSVSITIPCVIGPYTSLNCTLSLTNNWIRISDTLFDTSGDNDKYGDQFTESDDHDHQRFIPQSIPITSIATSHGQNDSGVFELNFNDERYLPFEGAGVISSWEINLPKQNNQFDFATISDIILHIKYTSISSKTEKFVQASQSHLETTLPEKGIVFYALKNDFNNEWYRFLNPTNISDEQELVFSLQMDHLPFYVSSIVSNKQILVSGYDLIVDTPNKLSLNAALQLPDDDKPSDPTPMQVDNKYGNIPHLEKVYNNSTETKLLGDWKIKLKSDESERLKSADINNVYLIIKFKIK